MPVRARSRSRNRSAGAETGSRAASPPCGGSRNECISGRGCAPGRRVRGRRCAVDGRAATSPGVKRRNATKHTDSRPARSVPASGRGTAATRPAARNRAPSRCVALSRRAWRHDAHRPWDRSKHSDHPAAAAHLDPRHRTTAGCVGALGPRRVAADPCSAHAPRHTRRSCGRAQESPTHGVGARDRYTALAPHREGRGGGDGTRMSRLLPVSRSPTPPCRRGEGRGRAGAQGERHPAPAPPPSIASPRART